MKIRSPKLRQAVRFVGWNAFLIVVGLALLTLAGEAYFRLTKPFMTARDQRHFVPKVGRLLKPHTEVRHTNALDFWTVSRTNRLGFLDRDPPSPARAAASCHITMIGDSFVDAMEVPIADKSHVQLEALAARELPHLNVTTSAFGLSGTGQVQQLPLYDEYARLLRPKLLVLVFVPNDLTDNFPILRALTEGTHPERLQWTSLKRRADGTLELRPPIPDLRRSHRLLSSPEPPRPPRPLSIRALKRAAKISWFAKWLHTKTTRFRPKGRGIRDKRYYFRVNTRVDALRQLPRYAAVLEGWQPTTGKELVQKFAQSSLPPLWEDALDYTAFAFEQFKARATRDSVGLVILASHGTRKVGGRLFDRVRDLAAALDIPVIDQTDYILRQGATLRDAHWRHDNHWNVAGHRWAAEALLEWLKQHPDLCDRPANAVKRP